MTPVLIGKGHVLGGWSSKIEVIWVLGTHCRGLPKFLLSIQNVMKAANKHPLKGFIFHRFYWWCNSLGILTHRTWEWWWNPKYFALWRWWRTPLAHALARWLDYQGLSIIVCHWGFHSSHLPSRIIFTEGSSIVDIEVRIYLFCKYPSYKGVFND